jgi:transcriptional regulator of arginine metabolism
MPSERDHREERHRIIREVLHRKKVTRQDEIVRELADRGIEATQSSVSRDLREMGAAKIRGRYSLPSAEGGAPSGDGFDDVVHFVREVRPAGPHLTVVLTAVGAAQRVGVAIDRARWPEVVGTLAGDDTLFVAARGAADQRKLLRKLASLRESVEIGA